MSTNDEITKGVLELLAEIAKREKEKAVKKDNYVDAFFAQLFEGWLKEARKSLK
jgi:hypothetical protein